MEVWTWWWHRASHTPPHTTASLKKVLFLSCFRFVKGQKHQFSQKAANRGLNVMFYREFWAVVSRVWTHLSGVKINMTWALKLSAAGWRAEARAALRRFLADTLSSLCPKPLMPCTSVCPCEELMWLLKCFQLFGNIDRASPDHINLPFYCYCCFPLLSSKKIPLIYFRSYLQCLCLAWALTKQWCVSVSVAALKVSSPVCKLAAFHVKSGSASKWVSGHSEGAVVGERKMCSQQPR